MRLLMLNNEFPPLGGGTGIVTQGLLLEWADQEDIHVDLVSSSRLRERYESEQFAPRIDIYKVPVHNRNIHHSTNRELLHYAWRGWRFARRMAQRNHYDLALAWAGVPAGGIALWLKQEFNLPYIVSLQGADVPGFDQRYRRLYPALTPFLRRVWRQAAAVTACSEQLKDLASATEPQLAIRVIPNGVNALRFYPRPEWPSNGQPVRLLCSGRLVARKGQQFLIPAVAELRRLGLLVELSLVGAGDNRAPLYDQVKELALEDSVKFIGFVDRERMPEFYRQANIFVQPSYNEGMSLALLEAMASGLPVVVTDTGGTTELIHENGLVVSWGNVEELVQAISTIIKTPGLSQKMSEASLQIARRYSTQRVAHEYLNLCRQVAGTDFRQRPERM